ncbi:unnamed protein product [Paramecium primaurelia]|uniref:Uncharacterized protein n=1 Tax=Paramecium primaurelia TaxID=5886 RepID=A0A8S1LJ50_PARPR|nr:unnamed protein product [Paramecium primaurelia]
MNKIPINSPIKDDSIKYLQIIREKEESIQALQTINDQLRQDINQLQSQLAESFNTKNFKYQKLEESNQQLKVMLTDTQNLVLQYQSDIDIYHQIVEQIIKYTQLYRFNQKTTIPQILNFLNQEVFNQDIVNLWNELKQILKQAIDQINIKMSSPQLKEIYTKFYKNYENQYHPLSTMSIFEEIILMLNEKVSQQIETQVMNYSDQFTHQINKINLFETSIVLINFEEDQLKKKLKSQQKQIIQLKEELESQFKIKKIFEEQIQTLTMKSSERKPFIEILSIKDVSSSSEDDNVEILKLNNELEQKDTLIQKLQQTIQNQQLMLDRVNIENQYWDLIINCDEDSLFTIINQGWTLNFKQDYGLSNYQVFYSFLGFDSSYLQFILENLFVNDFYFQKLSDQTYLQLANNQLAYLKSIFCNEYNTLIQTKVLHPLVNNFYETSELVEGQQMLNEFWIKFSLNNGILFLCLKNYNQQNLTLLQLAINIQNQIDQTSVLIVIFEDEYTESDVVMKIIQSNEFIGVDDEIDDQQQNIRISMTSGDNFDFNNLNKRISKQKIDYVQQLNQFMKHNLDVYFKKSEQSKLEFNQSLLSENVYEMKLVQSQESDQIKLQTHSQVQVIKNDEIMIHKISDSQYDIFFFEKLQEVRLKSYQINNQGLIIKLKCTFDNDDMITKQYILKSTYIKEDQGEISHTIFDNKLILQL